MHLHQALAKALRDDVGSTMFGVMGDANLFLVDSYVRYGGTYVPVSHEASAVLAANGFARLSGKVGVATVTHGPALTNAATALVEGVRSRTPSVLVAGDTPVRDRDNLQNIDQRAFVHATGAGFEQVRTPDKALEDLASAVRRARYEERPVVLNLPADFVWSEVEHSPLDLRRAGDQVTSPATEALDTAVGIIANARRPIVLAGRGATGAASRQALIRLAARIGAPLMTTLKAKDLFRDEPLDHGVFGTLSDARALELVGAADCVIALGAGLNRWTTVDGGLLAGKAVVQVDVEAAAIGYRTPVEAGVVGDAAVVADTFVAWLDACEVPAPRDAWNAPYLIARDAPSPTPAPDLAPGTVDIDLAIGWFDSLVPRNRTLVFDGGRFSFGAFTRLRVEHPSAYVHTVNFGSIGLGMGTAIGAALGAPGRPVLLATGDGGFMMGGLTELSTAVRLGLDLVVAVFDDGAYGAEHLQLRRREMDPALSLFTWPDLAEVAIALGAQGETVRSVEDMRRVGESFPDRRGPLLIDVKIDPDRVRGLH